jgi:acylphosphatase
MRGATENEKVTHVEMPDVAQLSVTVHGLVQGVSFRYFVRNVARELGLKGYVRNLASGDAVEIKAEGEKPRLHRLLGQLKTGPPGARVEKVDIDWSDYTGQFDNFGIRY